MKKALLRYDAKNGINKNIGDYVQSVAAQQFTGDDVVLLEREHLHEYRGDPVKLIMGAWWMHYPENFPPADPIHPLFVSFHITPRHADRLLDPRSIAYLKKYEPIGCRGRGTQHILQTKGINSYLSGCLTLTLGETYKATPSDGNVLFVDPYYNKKPLKDPIHFARSLRLYYKHGPQNVYTVSKKQHGSASVRQLLHTAQFMEEYSQLFSRNLLVNATYYTHRVYEPYFGSEEEKFNYTDHLLRTYAQASLVVTSRLHVSLPTIAMGTPTLFVLSDKIPRSAGRFDGLLEHVNCIEHKDGQWKGLNGFPMPTFIDHHTKITNKNTHHKLAQQLIRSCEKFLH